MRLRRRARPPQRRRPPSGAGDLHPRRRQRPDGHPRRRPYVGRRLPQRKRHGVGKRHRPRRPASAALHHRQRRRRPRREPRLLPQRRRHLHLPRPTDGIQRRPDARHRVQDNGLRQLRHQQRYRNQHIHHLSQHHLHPRRRRLHPHVGRQDHHPRPHPRHSRQPGHHRPAARHGKDRSHPVRRTDGQIHPQQHHLKPLQHDGLLPARRLRHSVPNHRPGQRRRHRTHLLQPQ